MAEAIDNEPVMIMEGVARLDFGDTENGRVNAPTSYPTIAPGATVHQCTNRDLPSPIIHPLNPIHPMRPKTTAKSNLKNGNRNGRPALPENEKQSIIRPTKFNKDQDAVLMENFHRSGLSCVSEYIRAVSLNPKIVPRLNEEELNCG